MRPGTSSLSDAQKRGRRTTALACLGLAVLMVGAAFAAVPLYDMFCRVTGFNGTPVARGSNPGESLARQITVRFDTNVASALDWSFRPEVNEVTAQLGETQTVFFRVRNEGRKPATGVSTFNVQPAQIGGYFVKMKCFCFEEQTLAPGEAIDFPVVFYIDPALDKERSLADIGSVTLSYTYFASRNGQPVTAAAGKPQL